MNAVVFALVLMAAWIQPGDAFSHGPPPNTCWTLYPKHSGQATETTECPYKINFSPSKFKPGDIVTITVADPKGSLFKGIELGAHRTQGNLEVFVGQFVEYPEDKIKVFNCFTGFHNMAAHKNNNTVSVLTLKWKAPDEYIGHVKFRGTIVAQYDSFWVNVEKMLESENTVLTAVPSIYPEIPTNDLVNEIDFSSCGDKKGCYFYPRYCDGDDCIAAATYEYRSLTDDFVVELFTSRGPNYVSFGLSDDTIMGNDATVSCASRDGFMSVQEGWNPAYHNERQLTRNISDLEVRHKDGNTLCRFIMPGQIQVYHVMQNTPTYKYSTQMYDTDKKWYLMLAWGKTMPASDVMSFHKEMPSISFSEVNIREKDIVYGSAYHILVRVHGALMIIAWVLFTGIVTVISRHFKDWMSDKKLFGTKIWFQIHRELAVLVAIFTGIGLAVVFAHYGSTIREEAIPHAYVGLAVTGCVGLQIVAGILRPGLDHKLRPVFNWAHRFLGQASHILAAATMFLAYEIDYVTPSMRKFGFITLGIWVGGQVLLHLIFEVIACRRKTEKTDFYDMSNAKGAVEVQKPSKLLTAWLCIYIVCLVLLSAAILASFLLF